MLFLQLRVGWFCFKHRWDDSVSDAAAAPARLPWLMLIRGWKKRTFLWVYSTPAECKGREVVSKLCLLFSAENSQFLC